MTLELNKVSHQVVQLGEQAAQRQRDLDLVVPQVQKILRAHANDADLRDLARRATETQKWRGAIPTAEPLDAAIDPPAHPDRLTIIAGDGSQIYPDAHGAALYYLINVGTIIFKHGSDLAPIVATDPKVFGDAEALYEDDRLVSTNLVNARRNLSELAHVVDLTLKENEASLAIALLDGTLALWAHAEGISQDQQDQLERDYIHRLDQLKDVHIPIGAFVSRPRSTMVAELAALTDFDNSQDALTSIANNRVHRFKGLRDTAFFSSMLRTRQRSAVFEVAPGWNTTYRDRGNSIHFFYVNVGDAHRSEIARVEVPVWVAEDRSALGLLHAAIVEQCTVSRGYPYVLARAHEIAVVTNGERAEFENMIATQLMRSGIEARPSEKAFQKSLLVGKRR